MFCFQEARLKAKVAEAERELEQRKEEASVLKEICSNKNAQLKKLQGGLADTEQGI